MQNGRLLQGINSFSKCPHKHIFRIEILQKESPHKFWAQKSRISEEQRRRLRFEANGRFKHLSHLSAAAVTKRYQGVSTCTHRVKLGTSDLVEWNKRSLPGTKCEQRFHKTLKERNQCHHTVGSK